jgi:hypothetical protein
MRRGVHIAFTLLIVLVLIRPFDCFAGTLTRKAAACCAKGKCLPSSNADECCKNNVPARSELSGPKTPEHSIPVSAVLTACVPVLVAPSFVAEAFDEAHAPPGSPPGSRLILPLLI